MIKKGSGDKAILMLHGRGGSAEDILSLSNYFEASCYAFTANNNVWYPYPFNQRKEFNEPHLSESLKKIDEAVSELKKKHEQVYLLGFSQGACLALEYAANKEVDGVIAFSGGLIGEDSELEVNNKKSNVFIGCSENDPFIPLERAKKTRDLFLEKNSQVLTFFYPGNSHTIRSEEMELAKKVLG